ncbi:hypothetical protein [Nocardioides sp. InS609-2]|uniref:hypothetical protein n=1 Tax=Nocardioides sp. InS609-2 TaxID=2760705 RepID=UPI0020BDE2EB|nr:hypothetical protein [Nocardioides sp. InS609-2]
MTTTANISAKGCSGTGITEDLAQTLHNNLGKKVLAVVELVAEARQKKRNGDEKVVLSILTVEPAPNDMTVDHLRDLAQQFYYERQLAAGEQTLPGTGEEIEPKVSEVIAAGQRHTAHPYIASGLAVDNGACDVCGLMEDAPVHADRSNLANPFLVDDNDDGLSEDEGDPEPDDDET